MSAPRHYPCEPNTRLFPTQWKSIWFRQNSTVSKDGQREYECPLCSRRFTAHDLEVLQGDHIWPYSLFGATVWDNYRLICSRCNREKGAWLDKEIRTSLSSLAFRYPLYARPAVAGSVARTTLWWERRLTSIRGRRNGAKVLRFEKLKNVTPFLSSPSSFAQRKAIRAPPRHCDCHGLFAV